MEILKHTFSGRPCDSASLPLRFFLNLVLITTHHTFLLVLKANIEEEITNLKSDVLQVTQLLYKRSQMLISLGVVY